MPRLPLPRIPLHRNTFSLQPRPLLRKLTSSSSSPSTQQRIDRLLASLPSFLHPYTSGLRNAPVSHITAFLILHEITAIVPLVGLAATFHYAGWLPDRFVQGKWVNEGMERFGRYFGRKGWFGFTRPEKDSTDPESNSAISGIGGKDGSVDATATRPTPPNSTDSNGDSEGDTPLQSTIQTTYNASEQGTRILVEVATAYAITKLVLPVRIAGSVWAAPWFARVVLGRFGGLVGRVRGRGKAGQNMGMRRGNGEVVRMSGAAGTGATGGGVIGKGP